VVMHTHVFTTHTIRTADCWVVEASGGTVEVVMRTDLAADTPSGTTSKDLAIATALHALADGIARSGIDEF